MVLLETLTPKPDIKANREPWMTENDTLGEFQIERYQPIVSIPRKKFRRRSEVVAFYVKKGIENEPIETSIEIERQLIKVKYDHDVTEVFCVIHRTGTVRLTQFLPKIEKIVFPKITSLRYETFILGDFNSNTSITVNNKVKYESLLNSYDCKIQNTLPHTLPHTGTTLKTKSFFRSLD